MRTFQPHTRIKEEYPEARAAARTLIEKGVKAEHGQKTFIYGRTVRTEMHWVRLQPLLRIQMPAETEERRLWVKPPPPFEISAIQPFAGLRLKADAVSKVSDCATGYILVNPVAIGSAGVVQW